MKMKTLTVNGVSYTVTDPNAAHIEDNAVSPDTVWSSQVTLDRLCPDITLKDSSVSFFPVENTALSVISAITPRQEGSGNPSPANVRPISGHSAVKLNRNDTVFTIDFGQIIFGGSFHWNSGVLTIDRAIITLDGTEQVTQTTVGGYNRFNVAPNTTYPKEKDFGTNQFCSHFLHNYGSTIGGNRFDLSCAVYSGKAYIRYDAAANTDALTAFLVEQYANGTPVQIVYEMLEPVAVQLTPQEITALPGENTLHSDTGDTTVTGKGDPTAVMEKIINAIIALGGNV